MYHFKEITVGGLADVARLVDFEQGLLDQDEVIELFQGLIDTGLAWQLQGSYGRLADRLITSGKCTPKPTDKKGRSRGPHNDLVDRDPLEGMVL